jgi:thioesterase domain-containing protein
LVSRIRASLDVELTIRSLFEAPSVQALSKGLVNRRPAGSDFEVLLPIRASGTKSPLFCIHDAGGFSWPYSKFIGHIPAEHPIYGLQARNLTIRESRPRTIDEMANDYVRIITSIQAEGPFHLVGWSFGGLVAHAVATRLQSMGAEVALLAILDSYPVQAEHDPLSEQGDLPPDNVAINPIRNLLDVLRREGLSTLQEHQYEAIMDTFKNNTRIVKTFTPRCFVGDVCLFTAMEGEARRPTESWRPYVDGEIKVHPVYCAHDNMLDAGPASFIATVLARELRKEVMSEHKRRGENRDKSV